jgi:hypothetical protein
MKHATKKQQKVYNGFAVPMLPDTQLGLAMLIAEDEDGHTQPVAVASTINEAKKIAQNDLAGRTRRLERGNDSGLSLAHTSTRSGRRASTETTGSRPR